MHITLLATSSVVPPIEFERGVEVLRRAGHTVHIDPRTLHHHFTFAGADADRAAAFWDAATSDTDIVYCARGGYGATRLLPILQQLTDHHGPPPNKLLVGYSDITALHHFVHTRWNWPTLHAPMPSATDFPTLHPRDFNALLAYLSRTPTDDPWSHAPLHWLTPPPAASIEAPLFGGNLTVYNCLTGTPWQPSAHGKILFFEDIGEAPYRIDRMITQLLHAGAFDGAKAIVLGDFTNCNDERQLVCASPTDPAARQPLRRYYQPHEALQEIFGSLHQLTGLPIASGLPVGHGPNFSPLPLNALYSLTPTPSLHLLRWPYLENSVA